MFALAGAVPDPVAHDEPLTRGSRDKPAGGIEFFELPPPPATGADFSFVNGLAYGKGAYIATVSHLGEGCGVYRSTDFQTWALVKTISTNIGAGGVAFGNGVFVVGGDDGGAQAVHTSDDGGLSWTSRTIVGMGSGDNEQRIRSVCFANDAFFVTSGTNIGTLGSEVVGETNCRVYRSEDGVSWTGHFVFSGVPRFTSGTPLAPGNAACYGVAYDPETEKYCAVGSTLVHSLDYDNMVVSTSIDGMSWSGGSVVNNYASGPFSGANRLRGNIKIAAGGGKFIAVARKHNNSATPDGGAILRSVDGSDWGSALALPSTVDYCAYSKRKKLFLAGNSTTARTSPDANTWTAATPGTISVFCASVVKKKEPDA
jgi:hypothetical protein